MLLASLLVPPWCPQNQLRALLEAHAHASAVLNLPSNPVAADHES